MPKDWRLFQAKFKEIWRIDITDPESEGHEQEGERPCLIIRAFEDSKMILIVPFTGVLGASRFPYIHIVRRDKINILPSDSVALVYQMRSVMKSRLIRQIGRLTNEKYRPIKILIRELFRI